LKFFSATGWNDGYNYPYFLANTSYITLNISDIAEELIIDSDIHDDAVTNDTIAETSKRYSLKYGRTFVVPKDYFRDPAKTIESVKEFVYNYVYHGELLVPLQPDEKGNYWDCFQKLRDYSEYFGIGGLADLKDAEQFRRIKNAVTLISTEGVKIHLFGIFPSRWAGGSETDFWRWLVVDKNRDLIESCDSVVCETCAATGNIFDMNLHRHQMSTKDRRNTEYKHALATANCWAVQCGVNEIPRKSPASAWGGNLSNLKRF